MPDYDDNDDEWSSNVESRLISLEVGYNALNKKVLIGVGLGSVSFVAVLATNLALKKLMESISGMAGMVGQHHQFLTGGNPPDAPPRHLRSEDETIIAQYDDVAPPSMGPESEVSDRVREAIETDPLKPKDIDLNEVE